MNSPLLSIDRLHIAYPHTQDCVVQDFSLQLQPGERLGLVGESGCGKSTLGRALLNLLPPGSRTEGEITVDGQSVLDLTPARARRFRGEVAALVFQDPMTRLNPLLSVGDHCIETLLAHDAGLNRQQSKQRALDTLDAVKIPAARWQQFPHEFSGGMRQRVAIALALLLNPKLIVADEPTTSLDVTIAAQILGELTRLCADRQMALVLISHDLAVVGEYCDRIAVMYAGKLVETGSTDQVFRQPAHDYTKSLLKSALYLESGAKSSAVMFQSGVQPLLQLKQLKQHYTLESGVLGNLLGNLWGKSADRQIRAVDGIDLEIYPGETLGLVGESGCGKSTLSRTILQLLRPTSGSVEFDGQDLGKLGRKAIQRQRRDIQMIFQDPNACLNPRMTVAESIVDPLLIHKMTPTIEQARAQVETVMQKVGLDPAIFSDRYPGQLSGGQQQRVAIARALITQPKLVICDEPVSMLDATVRTQVLDLMRDLKEEFKLTYLFITHDLWVARFFCDRIAVMNQGKIIELGQTDIVFNNPQQEYTKTLLGAAPMLNLRAS